MKTFLCYILLFLFRNESLQATMILGHLKDTIKLEDFFVDSLNIGRKKFNKIELSTVSSADSFFVIIKFYSKAANKSWILKQTFHFEKDHIMGCDPKLSDFNNDGLKDLTYISAVAARGANEVRKLFIYDKIKDNLIYLKNSEDYPNLLYNNNLNCIDAFLVYGGCSTVFLKIKSDSLIEFASIELDNDLRIYEIDNKGVRKMIKEQKDTKMYYVRFSNYNPLTPSENY